MSNPLYQTAYRYFSAHNTDGRTAVIMTELGGAPPRLLEWIKRQPDDAPRAARISRVIPWLVRGFAAIEDVGANPVTMSEFEQKARAVLRAARTVTNDRALRQLWQEHNGTLLNSILFGLGGGDAGIIRTSQRKSELPFDVAVLGDNGDDLIVSCIIFGCPDDTPAQIQRRIKERFSGRIARDDIIPWLLGEHRSEMEQRTALNWYCVGGPSSDDADGVASIKTCTVVSYKELLESIELPGLEFRDYLTFGDEVDRYTSDTGNLCDPVLNNARFSLRRRCLTMEEWAFARRLMTPHHKMFKHNQEILAAINLVSPLEASVKIGEIFQSPEWQNEEV